MRRHEFLSYFGDIGLKKFPKTLYVRSAVPSEDNALHFYRLEMAYALVHTIKVHDITAIGARILRWHCLQHFLFACSRLPSMYSRKAIY
uniref:Uncharacterized protein n=1 Tax=Rhipicephalus appendiculatus TaxID=34631 RepID=A0A131YEW3_RHIAP